MDCFKSGPKLNMGQQELHSMRPNRHLIVRRRWMPVFVYAAVVTSLAAALLTLAAAAVEGAVLGAGGAKGVFGWATDLRYLPKILYLAVVPGILGHQGGLCR